MTHCCPLKNRYRSLNLFYVQRGDEDEIESALHTPCWYPILYSRLTNANTHLYRCKDYDDAVNKIVDWEGKL